MRVFIAIELPAAVKTALAALQNELQQTRADVSWTKPENLHLTLKFLGEVAAEHLPDVTRVCTEVAAQHEPFALNLQDTGVFPRVKHPRVLWAGLGGDLAALQSLQQQVEENLQPLGFAKEARAFQPHLTLGRVRSLENVAAATAKLLTYALPPVSFPVHELVVMQSQLRAGGSLYTPLSRCPFQK